MTEPEVIDEKDIEIKYKKEDETYYNEWTNDNQPEQGFLKIQVIVLNRKFQINAYYIPSDGNPFKRDCKNGSIKIDSCINVVESDIETHSKTDKGYRKYKDYDSVNRDKTNYIFKIGSADNYIVIPIIKPYNVTELYKDGEFIKEYKNDKRINIRIPIQFKDKYSLRRYNEEGLQTHHLCYEHVDLIDFEFDDDESSLDHTFEKNTPAGTIDYYLCTGQKYVGSISTGYKLNIGENSINNYIFYFWDMKLEHDPFKIKCDYNDGLLDLHTTNYPNGIIFQSLDGDVCPRHYCKPILTTPGQKWPKEFESEIACVKCFEIASNYNIPYRVFEPLYWLIKDTDSRLVHLFAWMIMVHWDDNNDDVLCENLVRFSREMYFAWPFLNIKAWRNFKSDCRNLNEYFEREQSWPIRTDFSINKSIQKAKLLFIKYGELTNNSNVSYLEEFTNIFWNSEDTKFPKLIEINNYKWFTYDKNIENNIQKKIKKKINKWVSLPTKALCFMRARPINNKVIYPSRNNFNGQEKFSPDIIGFCDRENYDRKQKVDNVRNIKSICEFLRLLYEDNGSYYKIIRLFKFYGIIN